MDMAYFLPAQINCLDTQVEAYAAAHTQAMHCFDVEELVSLFVSLEGELEKSTAKEQLSGFARQTAIAEYKHLATVGGRIRDMVARLRKDGFTVTGIDPFMRSLIRCRAAADGDELVAERDRVARGEITTRPIQELIDELQRRDNTTGG
jgi:hypothetical protein